MLDKKRKLIGGAVLISLFVLVYFVLKPVEIELDSLKNGQIVPWGIKMMQTERLWAQGFTGKGIKIAVMDSGISYTHPDLQGRVKRGLNVLDPGQAPIDDYGHGTLVSGVLLAQHNDIGIVGIAPDANLYPVKVLDSNGTGHIPAIIKGIEWCIENNIDIINMSFGIAKDNTELRDSIRAALDANIIIVASSMNTYGREAGYPASYEGVISVASIDSNFQPGESSPIGKIDFSAPGVDVISTSMNNDYELYSGTSLAAPHISGFIALLLQKDPESRANIKKELMKLTIDLGRPGNDEVFGNGLVVSQK
ncbi:S8 family peptidase [Paenibacillus elgii]